MTNSKNKRNGGRGAPNRSLGKKNSETATSSATDLRKDILKYKKTREKGKSAK